ncbi:NTP transferase domain-containing protein [Micromonospora cathayae]|uniref:NTP transferase domain-containing protein n=1 Tax=Micromonospora cathayae TaxID=3028804 RepID=A0ABY7ZS24_9ACTN|nr:NTP transferase domain-containing protein [Micromonospora sp. HUAS 3]WDZ85835.1 NTP transferase domain-containing protein [Micromonospora sp. HUAS 3]
MLDLDVLILAAGRGSRFAAGGGDVHKALAPVHDTTPLLWTVEVLRQLGAPPLTVVVGHRSAEVRAAVSAVGYPGPVRFVDNTDWRTTDSAYSFALGAAGLGARPVLLTYADVLVSPALVRRMAVDRDADLFALDRTRPFSAWDMRAETRAGRLTRLGKDLPEEISTGEAACVFRFRPGTVRRLAELGRATLGAVPAVQFERMLTGVLDELAVEPVDCLDGEWCEVDVPGDLPAAQRLVDQVRRSAPTAPPAPPPAPSAPPAAPPVPPAPVAGRSGGAPVAAVVDRLPPTEASTGNPPPRPAAFGEVIEHREVLDGRTWCAYPVRVIVDQPDLLAVHLAQGTRIRFGSGPFRWGPHPWQKLGDRWLSPDVVQLHRPGDHHAVWVLRDPTHGDFAGWYVNFQAPFLRTVTGFDTLDYILDLVVLPSGRYQWKDQDNFATAVHRGDMTADEASAVRREADRIAAQLDGGEPWWHSSWARWRAPSTWRPIE